MATRRRCSRCTATSSPCAGERLAATTTAALARRGRTACWPSVAATSPASSICRPVRVQLPAGTVLIASGPLDDGRLPADTAAWIQLDNHQPDTGTVKEQPSCDNRYRTAVLRGVWRTRRHRRPQPAWPAPQHPACRRGAVTISVSNLPPSTEAGAREAFLQRVEEFEAQYPEHHRRAVRVRVGRRHVRRPARRRHAADGVPDPVHRLAGSDRARPGGRHHRRGRSAAVRRRLQPQRARPSPRTPTAPSTACRSPATASACTTTGRCSRRPASTPTPRRRRGRRCVRPRRRSPRRPARPASPR